MSIHTTAHLVVTVLVTLGLFAYLQIGMFWGSDKYRYTLLNIIISAVAGGLVYKFAYGLVNWVVSSILV